MSAPRPRQFVYCPRCNQLHDTEEMKWFDGSWICPTPGCCSSGIGFNVVTLYEPMRIRQGEEPDAQIQIGIMKAADYEPPEPYREKWRALGRKNPP